MSQDLPSYPSMAACCAATGIPKGIMQQAKRAGCPAFDQANRVHLGKFLSWYFTRGDDEAGENWPDRLKRAQAKLTELKLAQAEGRSVDANLIERIHQRVGIRSRTLLSSILENELPTQLAGQDVEVCRRMLSEASHRSCTEMSKGLARWVVEAANDEEADEPSSPA